jgi:hypothetical protein
MPRSIFLTLGNHPRYFHTKSQNQRHRPPATSHHRFNVYSASRFSFLVFKIQALSDTYTTSGSKLESRKHSSLSGDGDCSFLPFLFQSHRRQRPSTVEFLRIPIMRLSFHNLESFSSTHIHVSPGIIEKYTKNQQQLGGTNGRQVLPLW